MPPTGEFSIQQRRLQDRRRRRIAFVVSGIIHLLIFVLFRGVAAPVDPYAPAGEDRQDTDDSEGSLQLLQIAVREPARPSVAPDARPVLVPEVLEIPELELALPSLEDGLAEMVIGEIARKPGLPGGTGSGAAGAGGGGTSRTVPPSPRGIIIPPTHDALRGKRIEVWVFVDERGRVVPDSTRLVPPTRDNKLNERLIREAADWRFSPALSLGQPVGAWFPYTISMGETDRARMG